MRMYKTPGVYVEEIATLPPSVADVATAVPAFIGYTEIGPPSSARTKIARIATMLQFRTEFGGPPKATFTVTVPTDPAGTPAVSPSAAPAAAASPDQKGKPAAKSGTDAPLSSPVPTTPLANGFSLYYALSLYFRNGGGPCHVVSVGDYTKSPSKEDFAAGLEALKTEDEPTLIVLTDAASTLKPDGYYGLCSTALAQCQELGDRFTILDVVQGDCAGFRNSLPSANLMYGAAYHPYLQTSISYEYEATAVSITRTPKGTDPETLDSIKNSDTAVYNKVKAALAEQYVVLPPSAAMAGIYARVDREQGVWKAPANVGVMAVIGPVVKIADADQEGLNVDPTAGKSINAIRAFTGKGTLVWGARTLAGNDNEWRYVSVRRLFIMIEEATKKASAFAVFEPNDQSTWLKVKAMIESYLYGLWQQGALAGAKPEEAYYVHVGLGTTMTPQDVLEGRMIVEIGVAAVRPAEFVVLRFSHKLQTA